MQILGFDLIGKDALTSDGRNLGTVSDLALDPSSWRIRDLRVAIDKRMAEELGLKRSRVGGTVVSIKTDYVKSVGDMVILKSTMRELVETSTAAKKAGDDEPFD